jgi:DNA-3-methyladenine glycosylase I
LSGAYCQLAPGDPIHGIYHDTEYGFPSTDESVLFERLVLEINQAGLSWITILKKRAAFRAAFAGFQVDRIAAFGAADIDRLLVDSGIVRNRLKTQDRGDHGERPPHPGPAAIPRVLRGMARCAPAIARGLDAAVSANLPLYRRTDR